MTQTRTHNNDIAYSTTGSLLVDFFSKAGSLLEKRKSYYGEESSALNLFVKAWKENDYKAMQLAMWCRDCRGGAGNRSGFRSIIKWLATNHPKWVKANLSLIVDVGRWDDLIVTVDTPVETEALTLWVNAIKDGNGLAAKWAPREKNDKLVASKLRKIAGLNAKDYRKLLVKNTVVVETPMCKHEWDNIDFNKVPSVAAGRYTNTFSRRCGERYNQWKLDLEKGVDKDGNEVKINASVLFPHDVMRTLKADLRKTGTYYDATWYGNRRQRSFSDSEIANAQFAALPDYLDNTKQRIMAICDFSGSMSTKVAGDTSALDVSMSLGLYCSDRLGKENPFYRKFIPFSHNSKLVDWTGESFSIAAQKYNDGFVGSTNIEGALDQILTAAKMFNATNDQIPTTLLIISDMQFNQGTDGNLSSVETAMRKWEAAGYNRPQIIYWNTAGYSSSPEMVNHKNVGLISGFSPSILKAVFDGDDFTPMAIMEKAIEKYKVVKP